MLASADEIAASRAARAHLIAGQVFGARYRIIRRLGSGGMGSVYQAWDDALGIAVALKVIRPELMSDPAAAHEIERRLKRELLLARQVTHPHVVRIHDLGEVDGIKYLTMPYIQGEDLASLIRRSGRLPVSQAVAIARQIAAGLSAAHAAGVVHRDLKPANVMIDADGQAIIMDFGISRSTSATGGTVGGAIVGTLEYMAPEQARGGPVDARADLYAWGLILYEMLAGRRLTRGDETGVAALLARLEQPPPSLRAVDPGAPEALDRLVTRCLQLDPAARFQTAGELVETIDRLDAPATPAPRRPPARAAPIAKAAAVLLLVGAIAAAWLFSSRQGREPPAEPEGQAVKVLIADFENRAADPVFDGVVEQALGLAIEGAPFITAYPRRDARRLAEQLRPGARLDEAVARLISLREGIDVVVRGSVSAAGSGYRLDVVMLDAASGTIRLTWNSTASDKAQVLAAVGALASRVRATLGDTAPESVQAAAAETFTAASLEAAHAYALGQDALWAGRVDESIAQYTRAVALDPELGRAYAGLAVAYSNSGRRGDAERHYTLAMARLDRMTERERYRTRGAYYLFAGNAEKAIDEFSELGRRFPSDSAGLANLALAHFLRREFGQALEIGRRAAAIYPLNVIRRNNVALYALYSGDFAAAVRDARAALEINPGYEKAWIALALAAAAEGRLDDAASAYASLEPVSRAGASYASIGAADLALYEGRSPTAQATLDRGIASDLRDGNAGGAARKLVMLASLHVRGGDRARARQAIGQAIERAPGDLGVRVPGARSYVAIKEYEAALRLARGLQAELARDARAYGALVEAEIALARGNPGAALDLVRGARAAADTWLGRFIGGRAYLEAGALTEAHSELEICLRRRGESVALFLDEVPTVHRRPPVPDVLGRAQQGLGRPAAAESYRTFLAMKPGDEADPLVADARARLRQFGR